VSVFGFLFGDKTSMVSAEQALRGRPHRPFPLPESHHVLGTSLEQVPPGHEVAVFGMGCFWGAERKFWQLPGVFSTSVGYAAGFTPNPLYEEVCSGKTGHTEVVRVVHDPRAVPFALLLRTFWENHDPTQGMRQGHDVGTQYRSAILTTSPSQREEADRSRALFQERLRAAGFGPITTTVEPLTDLWFAEGYHQQYLSKNPGGYCGLGGTGVSCPVGVG
jgi:peptide-methionine (S)-S-oxide reductase